MQNPRQKWVQFLNMHHFQCLLNDNSFTRLKVFSIANLRKKKHKLKISNYIQKFTRYPLHTNKLCNHFFGGKNWTKENNGHG